MEISSGSSPTLLIVLVVIVAVAAVMVAVKYITGNRAASGGTEAGDHRGMLQVKLTAVALALAAALAAYILLALYRQGGG